MLDMTHCTLHHLEVVLIALRNNGENLEKRVRNEIQFRLAPDACSGRTGRHCGITLL
jgi:hypothetical protein